MSLEKTLETEAVRVRKPIIGVKVCVCVCVKEHIVGTVSASFGRSRDTGTMIFRLNWVFDSWTERGGRMLKSKRFWSDSEKN